MHVFLAAFAFAGAEEAAAVVLGRFVGYAWCGLECCGEGGGFGLVEGGLDLFEADAALAWRVVGAAALLVLVWLFLIISLLVGCGCC